MKPDGLVDCAELVPEPGGLGAMAPKVRCNAPAEVIRTALINSTDGPVQHIETRCALGHRLFMPGEGAQQAERDARGETEGPEAAAA